MPLTIPSSLICRGIEGSRLRHWLAPVPGAQLRGGVLGLYLVTYVSLSTMALQRDTERIIQLQYLLQISMRTSEKPTGEVRGTPLLGSRVNKVLCRGPRKGKPVARQGRKAAGLQLGRRWPGYRKGKTPVMLSTDTPMPGANADLSI